MKKNLLLLLMLTAATLRMVGKDLPGQKQGKLTALRTCFDVTSYNIHLTLDTVHSSIQGVNVIGMRILKTCNDLQLDFNGSMQINAIALNRTSLIFKHDSGQVYVHFAKAIKKGDWIQLIVQFSGRPRVARKPPWDGGFVWSRDSSGYPWIGLACEGIGPSVWLPCKDHWSDEADSMDMFLQVPKPLVGVSNGKLIEIAMEQPGYQTYHWRVRSPINTYSINVNAARYLLIQDTLEGNQTLQGKLPLSYYVLVGNEEKARKHFKQVKTMLACFAKYYGDYPFGVDGYKLVETPYWGMEHQSCVAYGNHYKNNDFGFDFIIIHESAHEWFANSVTADDPADMWIHESFTTYSESLFVEYISGYQTALKYLQMQRPLVMAIEPMIGPKGVYYHGWKDNDIYYKGSWMLHSMRGIIGNDSAWFGLLKGFYQEFAGKIITTKQVISYFNAHSDRNWDPFFKQYLFQGTLPTLEYKLKHDGEGNLVVQYRWKDAVKGFEIPVHVTATKGKWEVITPGKGWQLLDLNYFEESDFKIKTDILLMATKRLND